MAFQVFILALGGVLALSGAQATPISLHKSAQQSRDVDSMSRQLMKSEAWGGLDGSIFDDVLNSSAGSVAGVHYLNISFDEKQVGSIEVTYYSSNGSLYNRSRHGDILNPPGVGIILDGNEYIERIDGQTDGMIVNQLTFTTRGPEYERKVYGPFGGGGPLSFTFEGFIVGFHGRSGKHLNQIGVYSLGFVKKSEAFGGSGGDKFDELIDIATPPIVGLSRIIIDHGDRIDSIQAEYLLLGDVKKLGEQHGGNHGNKTTITFDRGEVITRVEVEVDKDLVSKLTLITLKLGGIPVRYGPFGKLGTTKHSMDGNILGFYGNAGLYMDGIGFYYV